ncbi:MAG: hypothetical protein LBI12_02255 [Treponema sp.]|nr:hypothetical protein [Treponema sp.]
MKRFFFTDFALGLIIGFIAALIICGVIFGIIYCNRKNKEKLEYVEKIQAVEQLREDYNNTDAIEFLDTLPDVRRAADGAAAEFERKRDEAFYRFRNRLAD